MDYRRLFEEKNRLTYDAGDEERQAAMEQGIRRAVEGQENLRPRIHDMMKKSFVSCSEADRTLTLAYEVEEWELNAGGTMHGGMIAAAMDTTCGMTARYLSGSLNAATVSLTVSYLRPVPAGGRLLVTAKAVRIGRSLANLTAEAVNSRNGKTAALATAVFRIRK
ncbi:PaaI family thioesterase [Qiania dongpingensis]|uniref:PaaI family thioesterase n=1 Tax=Qiania dongpingensis TaxID=2763669 RepID=A0A7G9G467_9FIRM|nr:PaaI family thioesterase [Qiania dongpingensis]QNM05599.1 PaaI family thioesterase [Qiania dongpingensis]